MKLQLVCEEAIEPACQHFKKCGGCKYQHIPYDEQLEQKRAFVRSLFDQEVDPIVACDHPWHYRNKMEFSFSQDKKGNKFLGLFAKRGRVENLEQCELTSSWFIEVLENVRSWWEDTEVTAYHPPKDMGSLRTLTLREGIYTGEKMVVLTVSGHPDFALSEEDLTEFTDAVGEADSILLRTQYIAKKTPTRFEERVLKGKATITEKMHDAEGQPYTFRIRAASFFQPNTKQAETLYQLALECADLHPDEIVYDLYCGTGTLGIFASKHVKKVVGIELVSDAVEDAQVNLACNDVTNMDVLCGDVGKMTLQEKPTTIIVDPPRAGLSAEAIKHLLDLAPEKIVYVSCNPVSQATNCEQLEGYVVERLIPVDQFPHTPHVENIALLRKI